MKSVSLKDLKSKLSFWTDEAYNGQSIQITKHNKPFVVISRSLESGVYYGKSIGKQTFTPLSIKGNTLKALLDSLKEDRND